ncbi:MAG: hypothetical protein JRJ87_24285 [Deltaproteobacteria bacterium]|nr:hypothetical protein [Deltaproteobacteria bacterium]
MTSDSEQPSGAQPEKKDETAQSQEPAAEQKPAAKPKPQPSGGYITPAPFPVAGQTGETSLKEMRTRGQRYLIINVLLMFFVSIVVFTIGVFFFLVPRIVTHDIEIRQMESKLGDAREELSRLKVTLARFIAPTVDKTPAPEATAVKPKPEEKPSLKKPTEEAATTKDGSTKLKPEKKPEKKPTKKP